MGGGKTTRESGGPESPCGIQGRSPSRESGGRSPPEAEEFLKKCMQILRILGVVFHTFSPMFFRACRRHSTSLRNAGGGMWYRLPPLSASWGQLLPLPPPGSAAYATQLIFTKFDRKMARGPKKKRIDFGGNPDHVSLGLGWTSSTHTPRHRYRSRFCASVTSVPGRHDLRYVQLTGKKLLVPRSCTSSFWPRSFGSFWPDCLERQMPARETWA